MPENDEDAELSFIQTAGAVSEPHKKGEELTGRAQYESGQEVRGLQWATSALDYTLAAGAKTSPFPLDTPTFKNHNSVRHTRREAAQRPNRGGSCDTFSQF